ncbi:MAG TPA: hypothetical protein VFR51_00605 [Pyrinomonadaceae bacterium]|nr:hypothetical protein [Pyrinomonadaceae bacterium]
MIHSRTPLVALLLGIVLLSGGYARAQQQKEAAETEEVKALREKAYKLLDLVASQLNTLQSSENRARMGSNLVDSLWKHDEERARSLLRMVQEDVKAELQKRERAPNEGNRFDVFLKLRRDTVDRLAKHDGEAALEFLRVTKPVFEGRHQPYEFLDQEQAMELRLARQIASNNPDAALKLARQALEVSYSTDVLKLLAKLNRTHKTHGQLLFKDIVEKLADGNLEDWNTRNMAQTLVQGFAPPTTDESMYRELIAIMVKKGLDHGCGEKPSPEENQGTEFCRWLATTIAAAEQYDSRAAKMKQWVSDGYESYRFPFLFDEMEELLNERAYDEVEALASKHPELQEGIYLRAIQYSVINGDTARARKLIDGFPGGPERRQELLAGLEEIEKSSTVTEEKLAQIKERVEELPDIRSRASFLLVNANVLGQTDRNVAMKLLNQASDMIEAMPPGKEQTLGRMDLAMMYASEKSDRGFAIMESLLPKLNELIDVSVKLDGYDTNYLRDGEWNMSASGATGEILTRLSAQAGRFAWCDFDRAVNLASQFERPEIRLMAHLKLAQSILAGPPKRIGEFYE